MNTNLSTSLPGLETLQARFAARVTARLTEHTDALPHHVTERLRFSREVAVRRAAAARALKSASGAQAAPKWQAPWWMKLASFAPLALLLVGLGVIGELHDRSEITAAAEVDVALLADRLPPQAYQDAGFLEYLKTSQE